MKIAIHHTPGSFSDGWIKFCQDQNLDYKTVNAYDNDIILQLSDCDVFLWHHHHANYKDVLFAKQLLYSLETKGIKVFPNFATGWHFDDKVGQKYLLESINAPMVPSFAFYSKKEAFEWIEKESFPKVFKLRGGASSSGVFLARTKKEARKYTSKSFSKGFKQFNGWKNLKNTANLFKSKKANLCDMLKAFVRVFVPTEFSKMHAPEKGYAYFQEFIPENKYDTRVIVIGNKAYGMHRMVRKNDFRASGSSCFDYSPIREDVLSTAFNVAHQLNLQSVAFDFIYTPEGKPLIVEMSYGFGRKGSGKCKGYWTEDLSFHECVIEPEKWILENIIK